LIASITLPPHALTILFECKTPAHILCNFSEALSLPFATNRINKSLHIHKTFETFEFTAARESARTAKEPI
jgi:hypothetical protein